MNYGFFRVACSSPEVAVAGCNFNEKQIIETVKKANSLSVDLLDLFHHRIDAIIGHSGTGNSNNRAIVQEFFHRFTAFLLILARLARKMHRLG